MTKRLVVCCDGTWDHPNEKVDGEEVSTNVVKRYHAVAPDDHAGSQQVAFYSSGVGTEPGNRWLGGIFGLGLSEHILEGYRDLIGSYEPGDQIFLFGFSRGAYTARSLAGLIRNSGLLKRQYENQVDAAYDLYRRRDDASAPDKAEAIKFREAYAYEVRIHCIGVWDTVGALGIPIGIFHLPASWLNIINKQWEFHDVKLSSYVDNAFHALAIDERRQPFKPTLWNQQQHAVGHQQMEQVWFAGVHRDVGGGEPAAGLSDIALDWLMGKAASCGLVFDKSNLPSYFKPEALAEQHDSRTGFYLLLPAPPRKIGHPKSGRTNERLDPSVLKRVAEHVPRYLPANLLSYLRRRKIEIPSQPT